MDSFEADKTQKFKLPKRKTIPRICSWCNKIYDLTSWEVEGNKKTGVSHGMCLECHEKHLTMFAKKKKEE